MRVVCFPLPGSRNVGPAWLSRLEVGRSSGRTLDSFADSCARAERHKKTASGQAKAAFAARLFVSDFPVTSIQVPLRRLLLFVVNVPAHSTCIRGVIVLALDYVLGAAIVEAEYLI